MKMVIAVMVIVSFIIGSAIAFAETEKTLFQMASDSMAASGKTDSGEKSGAKVNLFQSACESISQWDVSADKVKKSSLRGDQEELAKRRGM